MYVRDYPAPLFWSFSIRNHLWWLPKKWCWEESPNTPDANQSRVALNVYTDI